MLEAPSFWDDTRTELTTPEQVDLHLDLATVGSRALALLVDLALRGAFLMLVWVAVILSTVDVLGELGFNLSIIILSCLAFGTEWFYFTFFEWVWRGQTPGKRVLGLRVIKADGSPSTPLDIILRNFTRPFDTTGPFALIGMAFIFATRNCQRPGDILGQTIVVREGTIGMRLPHSETSLLPENVVLTPAEWELLHRFLARAPTLALQERNRLAFHVTRALKGNELLDLRTLTGERNG